MDTAELAEVPITAEIPFLNPVTKNKVIFHFISIIGELEKKSTSILN